MTERNRFRSTSRFAVSIFLSLMGAAYSHSQEASSVALPETEIRALANRILQEAGKADCKPGSCSILVADFTLPTGATSRLGMQIADQFSKELASPQNAIKIIERSRLRAFLEEERIPAALLYNEKAVRWMGKQLGATAVLRGITEDKGGSLRVLTSLLSCDKYKAGPVEIFTLPDSASKTDLSPIDSFPKTLSAPNPASIPMILVAGVDGISVPACLYCPPPIYTNPAREAKFNGTVVLQLTVSAQGRTIEARVVRGLPFGLNEAARTAVRDWQLKPATRDGQPVACMVMMETTFHLN